MLMLLNFYSGLEISLLDQMKLIYESNACCVENLILSSREHSKAFISESSTSSSASSCSASDEHEAQNVRKSIMLFFFYL